MNSRLSEGNAFRTWKRIFGLVGLASLALVCTGSAWAQAQPSQAQSSAAPSGATVPAASPGVAPTGSAPAAKVVMAQNSPGRAFTPKGQAEGIKVHGHWTIEVRNPDGKVATHREFENSLAPTTGGQLLSALLGRQVGAYSWAVSIGGTGICNNPQPLIISLSYPGTPIIDTLAETSLAGCTLGESSGVYYQVCTDAYGCFPGGLNPPSFLNPPAGTTSPPLPEPAGVIPPTILVLSGQMTAEQGGTITGVLTQLMTTANPASGYGGTPAAFQGIPALTVAAAGVSPVPTPQQFIPFGLPFTGLTLGAAGSCGGSNQPPCQLTVNQNQVVSVTVQLSFQ